jgi:hypothetical protein
MRQDVPHEMLFTLLEYAHAGSFLTFADFLPFEPVRMLLARLHTLLVSNLPSCYSLRGEEDHAFLLLRANNAKRPDANREMKMPVKRQLRIGFPILRHGPQRCRFP